VEEGATLDLGSVGKGIGCDVISGFLKNQPEVSAMIVNLGGSSVMTYGQKPDGSDWKVAVTDPRNTEGDYLGIVTLVGEEYLSTSGDYEKYFIQDGIRYHHILDPSDGYPADNGITAVTVVGSNGLDADGLSTACFVLGVEEGAKLLEEYNADGLFVDEDGNVYLTPGMAGRFELTVDTYEVKNIENS
jgi:thiamine biosynthesis lipoprotein